MKVIRIGAHDYELRVEANDQGDCGETDYIRSVISIHSDMQPSMRAATLIHEALHAMNSTLGEEHVAHALLDSLAEQIYHFLDENLLLDRKRLEELLW